MANNIWSLLYASLPIPNTRMFSLPEVCFYPFNYKGNVYTIDSSLWENAEEIIYPDLDNIVSLVKRNNKMENIILVSCYSHSIIRTIDMNYLEKLNRIPLELFKDLHSNYIPIGYDIVDVSGISCMTNIGYSPSEAVKIKNLHLKINQWGLIENKLDAEYLVHFINKADIAPEHTPFFAMNIWLRIF